MKPEEIVTKFNNCITNRDLEGLSALMTEDHLFIDTEENVQQGKKLMLQAWSDFFNQFPDYQNHFTEIESKDNRVYIIGYSSCKTSELDGSALWTAVVEKDLVKEWRVYNDTPENRDALSLKSNKPFK